MARTGTRGLALGDRHHDVPEEPSKGHDQNQPEPDGEPEGLACKLRSLIVFWTRP